MLAFPGDLTIPADENDMARQNWAGVVVYEKRVVLRKAGNRTEQHPSVVLVKSLKTEVPKMTVARRMISHKLLTRTLRRSGSNGDSRVARGTSVAIAQKLVQGGSDETMKAWEKNNERLDGNCSILSRHPSP